MQRILYYDCFSGISGDMNLGALIDLGLDPAVLENELSKLDLEGYSLDVKTDMRNGITGCNFNVLMTRNQHHHNTFQSISEMIQASQLSDFVKEKSIKVFKKIAEAEAKIHNMPIEKVHFHEVGAIDSIVDIVGAVIAIEELKIDKIISSTVVLGKGFVECEHGLLPVPAPATLEILKGIPATFGKVEFEATTPTGAGFLAAMADSFSDDLDLKTIKIGYGIGNKVAKTPNLLRVCLCETEEEPEMDLLKNCLLECNIDDMNPEHFDSSQSVV
jgi:pyridinium-3,5-bisthiocarboxylic acid mononucleotide nickel chelatase